MKLRQLIGELKSVRSKQDFMDRLRRNPKLVLPIRLSFNLSQKDFIKKVKVSQVTLIKYEKGRSKQMSRNNAEIVSNLFPFQDLSLDYKRIKDNYNKFNEMKSGKLMTTERARELQLIWQEKTTKQQKSSWGSEGARLTNKKARHTKQERLIIDLLKENKVNYKTHLDIATKNLILNADFVVYRDNKPFLVIEVTERESNLYEYSLSYCYKARLLREEYPEIKTIFIGSDNLSESSKNLLKNEFDSVLTMSKSSEILHLVQ